MTDTKLQEVKQGTWVKFLYNTIRPFGKIHSKQYQLVKQFSGNCQNLEYTLMHYASKTGAVSWEITDESHTQI